MNALTKWPVTKDAIEVLLTASGNKTNDKYKCLDTNVRAIRLHNICIPKILREDFKETKYEFKASPESSHEYNEICPTANKPIYDADDKNEQIDVIDEDHFKESYLIEKHLTKIAVDFITIAGYSNSPEADIPPNIARQEYTTIEEMVKQVFPQIIANDNSPVGTATRCVHEIHLKPGTRPVKQRIRPVPIN